MVKIIMPTFASKKLQQSSQSQLRSTNLKQPIDGGDRYRYLGINKNMSYSGMQNKEKVIR